MDLWVDGRSGELIQYCGNIVLQDLISRGERLNPRKGTTFEGAVSIYVGRGCTVPTATDRHWSNLSWDQHVALIAEARKAKKQLLYLFVTADPRPSLTYWVISANSIEQAFLAHDKRKPGETFAVHIRRGGNRYFLEGIDVTNSAHEVQLNSEDSRAIAKLFQDQSNRTGQTRKATIPLAHEPPALHRLLEGLGTEELISLKESADEIVGQLEPLIFNLPLQIDIDRVIRVGGTRVTLDTLVSAFKEGASAEEIAQEYPAVPLFAAYLVIGFYLSYAEIIDRYLEIRQKLEQGIRSAVEAARTNRRDLRERLLSRRIEVGGGLH